MGIGYVRGTAAEMDPVVLYRLLQLRIDVFVVEQSAAYPDVDGRDVEPGAELLWAVDDEDGRLIATARVLRETEGLRIGRVATAERARGRGVASELMRRAIARCEEIDPEAPIALDAQEHLAEWYGRFGFEVSGPRYREDGIPHVPMSRAAAR